MDLAFGKVVLSRLWKAPDAYHRLVYAPRKRTRRKTFFSELLDRDVPTGRLVSLGGDYNSTQDATVNHSFHAATAIGRDPSLRGIRASSQRGKFELKNWPVR
ncbi:hypothetical protein PC122_g16909 [Phytophthora cactorum]|nr:hypothetical protein PC122_g16909 [Phytophthora cactorum]